MAGVDAERPSLDAKGKNFKFEERFVFGEISVVCVIVIKTSVPLSLRRRKVEGCGNHGSVERRVGGEDSK